MCAAPARLLIAGALVLATTVSAHAQFGLPGVRRMPLLLPVPGRGLNRALPLPGLGHGNLRRAFGVVAVVAVGAVILGRLHDRDRREVAKRAKVAVNRNPDDRVVESYTTKDGRNQVTITAHPAQNVSDLKDDPALKQTAVTSSQTGTPEKDKDAVDAVKVGELPPDTKCRKVTTELEGKGGSKKKQESVDSKSANTSILCQTAPGEWKPASA